MANQFRADIPAKTLQEVQQHLNAIKEALQPYLISLTPDERKTMLRMADKTVAFVQKSVEYGTNSPKFVPEFVDMAELKQDVAGLTGLAPLHQQLEQLALDTDSTMMTAGSEAYGNALIIYNNIKFLARNKQSGAQAAYDDLRVRFPGRPPQTDEQRAANAAKRSASAAS